MNNNHFAPITGIDKAIVDFYINSFVTLDSNTCKRVINRPDIEFTLDMYEDISNKISSHSVIFSDDIIPDCLITYNEFYELVREECKQNIWFFFTHIVNVPLYGSDTCKFIYNLGTFSQIKLFNDSVSSILYNPRQSGSTLTLFILYLYSLTFLSDKYDSIKFITISENDKKIMTHKINNIKDKLPVYIRLMVPEINIDYKYSIDDESKNILLFVDSLEYNIEISNIIKDVIHKDYKIKLFSNSIISDKFSCIDKYLIDNIFPKINYVGNILAPSEARLTIPHVIKINYDSILSKETIDKMEKILSKDAMRREIYLQRQI